MVHMKEMLDRVRAEAPLVYFITNYVTVNDCANIALACGASPIMSDEGGEALQLASLCASVLINIGTVSQRTLTSMIRAARQANNLGKPVLLDPVGVGASDFRNEAVQKLLQEVNFSVIKGNVSEIKYLSQGITSTQGVDASATGLVNDENMADVIFFARKLSVMTGAVIVISGPIDIVADSQTAYAIRNGHAMMPSVTGTGCMMGAVVGCFLGANPDRPLEATVAAVSAMGLCGEVAHEKLLRFDGGTSTYCSFIIDAMSKLAGDLLKARAKCRCCALATSLRQEESAL